MKLREFKKGDIITRTKRFEHVVTIDDFNENLGTTIVRKFRDGRVDNSFIGKALEFICIKNGRVYYKEFYIPNWSIRTKDTINSICLDNYNDDNWNIFEVPEGMTLEEAVKASGIL